MDKLIAVEYNPSVWRGNGKQIHKPLVGCVGETLKSFYLRGKRDRKYNIPVRFPLLAPNARVGTCINDRDPLDPVRLMEEGLPLEGVNVFATERAPVSLYTRKRLPHQYPGHSPIKGLFESASYLGTHSRDIFSRTVRRLGEIYHFGWLWKREWSPGTVPSVFMEGRIYGIDAAIATYDSDNFDGVVIEVVTRPYFQQPPRLRYRCDTYLASNYHEYITYVDGVPVPQEGLPTGWSGAITTNYAKTRKPGEICSWRREHKKAKVVEKEKKKAKPVEPPMPSWTAVTAAGTSTTPTWHTILSTTSNNTSGNQ